MWRDVKNNLRDVYTDARLHSITAECDSGNGKAVNSINLHYGLSFTLQRTQELVRSFPSNLSAQVVLCLMFQMEEIRGLAATASGEALTLNISRYWWPLLSTVCVIIYGHISSLPAIWYGLRVPKIGIIMAHLFSWNISINLNCTVSRLVMWLQGGTEFRRGHWRLHVGQGCSEERRIILSWLLSDSWKCATQRTETGVTQAITTDLMSSVIRIHERLWSALSPLAHNPSSISSGDFHTPQQDVNVDIITTSRRTGDWNVYEAKIRNLLISWFIPHTFFTLSLTEMKFCTDPCYHEP